MSKILRNSFLSILCFLGFIWLHTFIRLNSYTYDSGVYGYLRKSVIAVIATLFYYWCFIGIVDPLDELTATSHRKCAAICNLLCILLTVMLIFEITTGDISFIGEQEITILSITISKRYIFDIFAVILFPVVVEMALKSITKDNHSTRSMLWGISSIILLSLIVFLLFLAMRNIWLIDLAVINISTVAIGTIKYIFPLQKTRRGNIVGGVLLYALLNIFLLSLLAYDGVSFTEFMYGSEWAEYREGVRYIVSNASLFGTSDTLLSSVYIHDWLINRNNYILQLLFYGGWMAVIGFVGFMSLFLILLFQLLGLKNFRMHRHQLVYTAAFTVSTVRTIMGTLYSFALFPYPVALPFGGNNSIITDSILFGLILYGSWENYKYERLITYKLVSPEIFLSKEPTYHLFAEDKEYEEEDLFDRVLVKDNTGGIICDVEWIYGDDKEFAVFIPVDNPDHQVFLLEHTDKGNWAPVNDPEISAPIMKEFVSCRMPDCMEVDDEDDEEN